MKKITINFIETIKSSKTFAIIAFLMCSGSLFAQAITDVFPTRVTKKSEITIIGSNFSETTAITVNGISIGNVTLVSSTEMTFEITQEGSVDVTGNILVGGVASAFNVEYVVPTEKELKNGPTSNITKITEIFTTHNGFWRSSEYKNNPNGVGQWPNNNHDLLAFTYDGVTYSTGVNDQLLTDNGVVFSEQLFFAYTTDGVSGNTHAANYLATGDMIDGVEAEGITITSENILGTTVYDAITDGVNGLNLGTGITNFNQTADVQFFSSGGNLGSINDAIPDFLVTQIASAGSTDIYYYADSEGNVVGRPIELSIKEQDASDGDALLSYWRLDLYNFPNSTNYGVATPTTRAFGSDERRPLRMAALKMDEFGIDVNNVSDINNINMVAGGTSDLAFLAYNRGSFDIKTPVFTQFPVSRYICRFPNSSVITFSATAELSGPATGDPMETLSYQWYKYNTLIPGATNSTYTLTGAIQSSDFATYKVKISNGYGAVVAPVRLIEGGTPTYWDGVEWTLPPAYANLGITVTDTERELVFSQDFNQETGVLEGCSCNVPEGSNVIFEANTTLKLYNEVKVEDGGTLTFESDASLIQTRDVGANNVNSGSIISERELFSAVSGDFNFWSGPVSSFSVNFVTAPYVPSAFVYNVNTTNTEGTAGDWVSANGSMVSGKGYLVDVPSAFVSSGFTAAFEGTATNGLVNIDVLKSPVATEPVEELRHWNLIGNPYPSALNVEEFLTANTSLEGNVRFWANSGTSNTAIAGQFYSGVAYEYGDDYVTYNRTGSVPDMFGGNLASGQGFFVQVDESASATSQVTFENVMRYDDAEIAYDNSQFVQTNESSSVTGSSSNQLVWLSLVDNTNTSSLALVGYVNGATNGNDRMYDAFSDGSPMRIYSTIGTSKMAIQGRALPFDAADLVPLGVDLPSDGTFTIGIDQVKGDLFQTSAQGIYLEDVLLDVVHDLRAQPYSFTGIEGSTVDRFILRYTPAPLSVDEFDLSSTYAFVKDNELNINSSSSIKEVTVYDLTGKQIVVYTPDVIDTSFTTPFNFSKGMYLAVIKVGEGNEIEVTKKIMN